MPAGLGCLGSILLGIICMARLLNGDVTSVGELFVYPIIFLIIAGVSLYFQSQVDLDKHIQGLEKIKEGNEDKKYDQAYYSDNLNNIIEVDKKNEEIYIRINDNRFHRDVALIDSYNYYKVKLKFTDIKEVKIIEDNTLITSFSKSDRLQKAVVGGVLGGVGGAVVGTSLSNKNSKKGVNKLSLQLLTNNEERPILNIEFFNSKSPVEKTSINFIKSEETLYVWYGFFKNLIEKNNSTHLGLSKDKSVSTDHSDSITNNLSSADEIRKLYKLYEEGIISQEEFQQQKTKILS